MSRSRKRKLQRMRARWGGMRLASAILVGGPMAHAEPDDPGMLEEVTVTAQKRSEDLQKVPISLQVLSGEKMQELQVTSFDDYAKFLPSVSFQSFGPGQAQLYFRGIASGGDGLHAGSDSATGLYLDETPVTTIGQSVDLHVYDIERVEALAGPQGTLYGASSLSGTLRLITNKPDATKFSAGYDLKGDKWSAGRGGGEFDGYVNVPLADNVAVRLVGYYERDGGYISNEPATRTYQLPSTDPTIYPNNPITINNAPFAKRNFNDTETYGGRAALKFDLNDSWSITPLMLYQHQTTNGTFGFDPLVGDLKVNDFAAERSDDHWYQTALTVEGKFSDFDLVYSGGYFERHQQILSDYSEYSVAYDYYGYSRFRNNAGQLIDPTQSQVQKDRYTKLTQEIRITSPVTDRFRYTVGAFYQRQTDNIRDEYLINGLGNNTAYDFSVTGQTNTLYLTQQERVDRDYALFGDATFDITSQLKVSAGIRGFVARNTLYGFFGFNNDYVDLDNGDNFEHGSGESACLTPPATGSNLPCVNTDKGIRESGQTHRVNLTYQIDPDRMVYGTYSTGFRPGGNNRRVGLAPYDSDTLSNYELGWKTAWFDHRLRANGAIFYEKWKGVQLGVTGPNGITDIFNVGNATVKGVESDITWLALENLEISASGTFVNAKTTTDFCGEQLTSKDSPDYGTLLTSCPGSADAPAGTRLPVTPEFKANVTARYRFNVGDYKSFVQGAALHQSAANSALESDIESQLGATPGFTSADFSIGTATGNWSAEAFIENAFDERGQLNRYGECGNAYCYANARIYPIKPRLFGVRIGQKF